MFVCTHAFVPACQRASLLCGLCTCQRLVYTVSVSVSVPVPVSACSGETHSFFRYMTTVALLIVGSFVMDIFDTEVVHLLIFHVCCSKDVRACRCFSRRYTDQKSRSERGASD